jgi:protein transport protein SEC23
MQAPLFKPAVSFYESLATRAVAYSHAVDVFACSLDQVTRFTALSRNFATPALDLQTGILELKPCVTASGGLCVIADSFAQSVFKVILMTTV